MSGATRTLLRYLRAYLDEKPDRRAQLHKFYREKMKLELNSGNLSRHLSMQSEPRMSATLVYIAFLRRAGELIPGKKGEAIFSYARPELLK